MDLHGHLRTGRVKTMAMVKGGIARLHLLRASNTRGHLAFGPFRLPCAIGRGGLKAIKREGDGGTPIGMLALRELYYRADQVARPGTQLRSRALRRDDGWCDAAGDRNYNRPVRRPYPASHELLWRDDRLYDVIGVLDANIVPRVKGRGSAIFLHIAREGLPPTEGCVALRADDLRRLLAAGVRAIDTRP